MTGVYGKWPFMLNYSETTGVIFQVFSNLHIISPKLFLEALYQSPTIIFYNVVHAMNVRVCPSFANLKDSNKFTYLVLSANSCFFV